MVACFGFVLWKKILISTVNSGGGGFDPPPLGGIDILIPIPILISVCIDILILISIHIDIYISIFIYITIYSLICQGIAWLCFNKVK